MAQICFDETAFYTYLFVLFCLIVLHVFYHVHQKDTLITMLDKLTPVKAVPEIPVPEVPEIPVEIETPKITQRFLNKIYNPLAPPENVYPGGSLYGDRGYDAYMRYQEIGYLTGESGQFPVFARYRDSGRTDRFQFYTISDSRNRIKIPFKTKNDQELFCGDPVVIPELGSFTFKKYPDEGFRYDPFVI